VFDLGLLNGFFQFLPETVQSLENSVVICLTKTGSGKHHDVQRRKIRLAVPEGFPD